MKRKSVLAALIVFVLLIPASPVLATGNIYLENFRAIARVIDTIYYKPIDFQACTGGKTIHAIALCNDETCFAEEIRDAFKRCLDPHSRYVPSSEIELDDQDTQGSFGGVGMDLFQDKKTGEVMIVGIIPGTPVDGSGIQEGDVIIQIDGEKIKKGMKLLDIVKWIRGPVGEEVRIYIRRNGIDQKEPFLFTREEIVVETVSEDTVPDSVVSYVLISQFTPGTSVALLGKIESTEAQGKKGVILDLRNDPGGLLSEAVCTVALFAPSEEYNVVTEYRKNSKQHELAGKCKSLPQGFYEKSHHMLPVVVLVNENSASASEIVAANLQELGSIVVGNRTYKKGTVQGNFARWSGILLGELWLTLAEYRTGPHDTVVDGVGVEPNVKVLNPKKENVEQDQPIFRSKRKLDFEHDLQLKKALEILKKKILK